MKQFFILLIMLMPALAFTQATVLLLKKNGKTIQRYYPGKTFEFTTTDGMPVKGELNQIIRDSLFLTYYQISQVPTPFGTLRMDTTGRFPLAFSMKNIGSLPRAKKSGLIPGILILGGLAYTALNIFNTVRDGDPPFGKDNIANVAGGLGAAGLGYLISRTRATKFELGKKYYLEIVQ